MSFKVRGIAFYLSIFVASWLAVRSLAASPEPPLEDPPVPLTSAGPEIADPALSRRGHRAVR
jgi:hypothetical protein